MWYFLWVALSPKPQSLHPKIHVSVSWACKGLGEAVNVYRKRKVLGWTWRYARDAPPLKPLYQFLLQFGKPHA